MHASGAVSSSSRTVAARPTFSSSPRPATPRPHLPPRRPATLRHATPADTAPTTTTPPSVDHVAAVSAALAEAASPGELTLIAQTAPAVRVAIAEAVGLPPGTVSPGQLVAGLKALGFAKVYDVTLGADLTICEEAMELLDRLQASVTAAGGKDGGAGASSPAAAPLPLLTSCCPGWVGLVEKSYPELVPHLSTCRSPHMMLGRVIKHDLAPLAGLDPDKVRVVSIMPCLRKQGEADRPWFEEGGRRDVDHVLTTVEVGRLFQAAGIDLASLAPEPYDAPLGAQSGSGVLFGSTGGVMEAALRTVAEAVSGEPLPKLEFSAVRGLEGVKEAAVTVRPRPPGTPPSDPGNRVTGGAALTLPPGVEEVTLHVAVANGLGNAKKLVKAVQAGEAHYEAIEVMACPGGCIGGGGQPRSADKDVLAARQAALYALDAGTPTVRRSHANPVVQELYRSLLGAPLSPAAHEHLHTHFMAGGVEEGGGGGGGGGGAAAGPAPHHCDFCGAAMDCREGG